MWPGAIRDERPTIDTDGGGNTLCGTGVDADGVEGIERLRKYRTEHYIHGRTISKMARCKDSRDAERLGLRCVALIFFDRSEINS